MRTVELRVDLRDDPDLGTGLHTTVAVHLPEPAACPARPSVLFCWPGGGYGKGYFDIRGPGLEGYSQAAHHAERGLVVVACDHLGVGGSSEFDRAAGTFANLAASNAATARVVLERLAAGGLAEDIEPLHPRAVLGLGQSYGGLLLIAQQGRERTFDGICVAGASATGVVMPQPPGNVTTVSGQSAPLGELLDADHVRYVFHWEDVPEGILAADAPGRPRDPETMPMWASDRRPGGTGMASLAPSIVDHWAAVIESPVLVAVGQRDVVADPRAELRAYRSSPDITLAVIPRMGHMHNFAGTRRRLWDRIVAWADTVAATAS